MGLRVSSDKKIRKVKRDLDAKARAWVEGRSDEQQ